MRRRKRECRWGECYVVPTFSAEKNITGRNRISLFWSILNWELIDEFLHDDSVYLTNGTLMTDLDEKSNAAMKEVTLTQLGDRYPNIS